MDISAKDIQAIADKFIRHLEQGDEIVAYNTKLGYATVGDLLFFKDQESFEKFAAANNNENALYFEWSAGHVANCIVALQNNKIDFDKSDSFRYADGVYSIYDPMQTANLETLKKQVLTLGFSEKLLPAIEFYNRYPQDRYSLFQRERTDHEKAVYRLFFLQNDNSLEYRLLGYEGILRMAPEIPDITVAGINARNLDEKMKGIDWSIDHHADSLIEKYMSTKEGGHFLDKLDVILKSARVLHNSGAEGRDVADKLMYKHWYREPWEREALSLEHIRRSYEWSHGVDLNSHPGFTVAQTYDVLKAKAAESLGLKHTNESARQYQKNNEQHATHKHRLRIG